MTETNPCLLNTYDATDNLTRVRIYGVVVVFNVLGAGVFVDEVWVENGLSVDALHVCGCQGIQ